MGGCLHSQISRDGIYKTTSFRSISLRYYKLLYGWWFFGVRSVYVCVCSNIFSSRNAIDKLEMFVGKCQTIVLTVDWGGGVGR
jgi:hypothetical protein